MAYNPYSAVNTIYNLKGTWDTANKAGDDNKKQWAAQKAQEYYTELRDNGYGYVADELAAADYTSAKAINDKWASKSTSTSTQVKATQPTNLQAYSQAYTEATASKNTPKNIGSYTQVYDKAYEDAEKDAYDKVYDEAINSALDKNTQYFNTVTGDHAETNKKYDDIYAYANQDVTQTDEYKSAFKNLMPSYTLAAMQGRDNAVASGGASNGGNIDSYAAANAMRQQAVLTAQGQQLAHQAGLDAYTTRVDRVKGILSDLGVYNQSVYSAMDNSISHDRGIANDAFNNQQTATNNRFNNLQSAVNNSFNNEQTAIQNRFNNLQTAINNQFNNEQTAINNQFKNEQTAINNAVDNNVKKASVTGYVPNEWAIQNDAFLKNFVDENGKLKPEANNTNFQALINAAKANGNTELANKYAILRGLKIFGDFANYGKYLTEGDVAYYDSPRTAEYDLTSKQIDSAEKIAKSESDTTLALADKEANSALNQIEAQNKGAIGQIKAQTQGEKEIIQENAKYIGGNTAALEEASNGYAKSIMENFNTGKITPPIKSLGNGKYSVDESKEKEFAKYVIDTYMDRIDDDTLYYMLTTSFNIDTDIIESVL